MCFGGAEMGLKVGERAQFHSVTKLSVESAGFHQWAQGLGAVVLVGTVDMKEENGGPSSLHRLLLHPAHPNLFKCCASV